MELRQSTGLESEYLMTWHAPGGGPPYQIDSSLTIFHTGSDGRVSGPKVNGSIRQPTADWLRSMPGGSLRVDARMIIRTDDEALIYASYSGVISVTPENFARMSAGDMLTEADMYFIITPVFQTAHRKYAWLNQVQAVGKVAGLKGGAGGYVAYDIFAIR